MRITEAERASLITVLTQYIKGDAELRLFGSRIDDTAKGGDIDLLLIVPTSIRRRTLAFDKAEILAEIKAAIGDQKIDLVICTTDDIQHSAFHKGAFKESLALHKWIVSS